MALSAKRPSRGDEARKRILHEVTETTEKKKRLNAEIEDDGEVIRADIIADFSVEYANIGADKSMVNRNAKSR